VAGQPAGAQPRRPAAERDHAHGADLARGFKARDGVSDGRILYVVRGDQRLLRFDARTGKRLSAVHAPAFGVLGVADGTVFLMGESGVSAVDAATGRVRWARDLHAQEHQQRHPRRHHAVGARKRPARPAVASRRADRPRHGLAHAARVRRGRRRRGPASRCGR
jgi:hypothetical protein